MGEAVQSKKKNNNNNENDKTPDGGGKKKDENQPISVVLKVDMHCEGCANKIIKCVKGFEGVQTVKAEMEGNKLTVTGKKIDASKLREKLANKTKKKVDLVSPQPKKEKDSKNKENDGNGNGNGNGDGDQSSTNNNKSDKKTDENKKKPKEPPVTTAVLKVSLHCQGCIEKIHRVTSKFKGVHEMSVDKQKDLVTVKGTMDVKALCGSLTERLKRSVEIVPPKKEKENNNNNKNNGGEKKDAPAGDVEKGNNEGGDNANGNGGGKKKKKGGNGNGNGNGNGGGGGEENVGGGKMEGNKMEYMGMGGIGYGYEYGYGLSNGYGVGYGYGYGPGGLVGENLHAPQLFSDENPNACSIM